MRTVLAPRASTILHDLIAGRAVEQVFLLPTNICPIVPITFFKAGIPIEFVDISAETLNLDLDAVRSRLKRHPDLYGGLIYAHTYGDPSTPDSWMREIKAEFPSLLTIDDRCLCVPDLQSPPGSAADVVLYSTGYAKIVDIGFGGFAFLDDDVACKHHSLPFRGADLESIENQYKLCVNTSAPFKYKDADWLQTDANMSGWDEYRRHVADALTPALAQRRAINAVYNSRIPPELQLPSNFQMWRFSLRLPHRQRALEAIFGAGLFASSHYAALDGIMGGGDGQNARELAGQVINLFNDQHYSIDMAERTAEIIRRSL